MRHGIAYRTSTPTLGRGDRGRRRHTRARSLISACGRKSPVLCWQEALVITITAGDPRRHPMHSFSRDNRSSASAASGADRATHVTSNAPLTKPGDALERAAGMLADRALAAQARTAAFSATGVTAMRAPVGPRPEHSAPDVGVVPAGGGKQLDPPVRTDWERAFRHDFSGVRVHSGPEASAMADRLGARAYSFGRNVVLGHGQSLQGHAGRHLLAHELAHVVQYDASGRAVVARQEADERTDAEVRSELEKRTGKGFAQLVLGLGRGPIDPSKVSPRELERELEENGTLPHRKMETKEPVVLDEVIVKHPYQENRFVTEARTGRQSQVDAEKAAGQQAVRETFVSNMTGALGGTRTGSASAGLVQPTPEGRRYEPRPPTTYDTRTGARAPVTITPQTRYVQVANPNLVARYERIANERLPAVIDQTLAAERATPARTRLSHLGTEFDALRAEVGNAPSLTVQQRNRATGILREARDLARKDFGSLQEKVMRRLRADADLQAIEGRLVAAGDARLNPTGTLQIKVRRADGAERFEPLNLEHRVRLSDDPWAAKGNRNIILTDAPQNQQYLEGIRQQGSVWPTGGREAFVVRHKLNDEGVDFAPGSR
ncbi:DUF4157 domain-containing protein [Streptomyces sp. NPDC101166]|uniref:eCIS core domain-containing protein n=1 Tax=Streptomyces sp. NPDC101166 TaxID=3366120 RepID=UPI00380CF0E3